MSAQFQLTTAEAADVRTYLRTYLRYAFPSPLSVDREKQITHDLAIQFCTRRRASHIVGFSPFPCGECCADAEKFIAAIFPIIDRSVDREKVERAIADYRIVKIGKFPVGDDRAMWAFDQKGMDALMAAIFPTPDRTGGTDA